MECNFNIDESVSEFNGMVLNNHVGKFYFSLFDENGNLMSIPVPVLNEEGETIGVQAMSKIESDEKQEIHLNFPLKTGFYFIKVFFDDSFQNGIIFQRIGIS